MLLDVLYALYAEVFDVILSGNQAVMLFNYNRLLIIELLISLLTCNERVTRSNRVIGSNIFKVITVTCE